VTLSPDRTYGAPGNAKVFPCAPRGQRRSWPGYHPVRALPNLYGYLMEAALGRLRVIAAPPIARFYVESLHLVCTDPRAERPPGQPSR
jgi:hypothetical protein